MVLCGAGVSDGCARRPIARPVVGSTRRRRGEQLSRVSALARTAVPMWACLGASWPGVPEVHLDGRVEASDLGHAAQQHQGGRLLAGYCEEVPVNRVW